MRALLLLALATTNPTVASEPLPLIPRRVLFAEPERASPLVSPDGRRLAWLAPIGGALNVWVRGVDEPEGGSRSVTAEARRSIQEFHWRGDSRRILYLQDTDGDENWRLYEVDAERPRQAARLLTPAGAQARVLRVDPADPATILVGLNQRDARFHDAFRLDLKSGRLTLAAQNPGDVEYFVADHALRVRAAYAQLEDGGGEIRVRDSETSGWRRLAHWGDDEVEGVVLGFSADNASLLYTSSASRPNAAALFETDLAGGRTRLVAADPAEQHDAGRILMHPASHRLEAVEFNRARREWLPLDAAMADDLAALRDVNRGDIEVLSRSRDDRLWTVGFTVDDGPRAYYLYDRQRRRARLLFHDRPELQKLTLAAMTPVSFPAADGLPLHGYLTLPPLSLARQAKPPLILYPHGGPYARDDWGLDDRVQFLANRGYAVLQVNYRGSTGYGKRHLQAAFRERGGKMSSDLIDAKRWAVAQGYADAERTCMYGTSYGGYATLVALAFTPEEFACGAEAYGASNLVSLLQSFPPYWTLYRRQWERRVGYAHEVEFLKSRSALFKVDRIRAPLLIGQGANDPRVVKAESDQMVEALRASGKPVEYLVYPDEGHGFVRPENRTRWFAAVEAFLARHLGGRSEPPGPGEDWSELRR